MEITIESLLEKGIGPKDVARVFGLEYAEVLSMSTRKKKELEEREVRDNCVKTIMAIVNCTSGEAGAVFDAVKVLLEKKTGRHRCGRKPNSEMCNE